MFVKSHCDLVKFEPEPESDRAESSKTIVFCESEHSVLRRFDKLVKPRAESFKFSMIVLRLWLFVTSWNSRKANERESSESFDRRLKAGDILISCVQDWLNLQLLNSLFELKASLLMKSSSILEQWSCSKKELSVDERYLEFSAYKFDSSNHRERWDFVFSRIWIDQWKKEIN